MTVRWQDRRLEVRRSGGPDVPEGQTRLPAGHPEGYLEAFANVYRAFYARMNGAAESEYPDFSDGLRGVRFIERVVESSAQGGSWLSFQEDL